MPYLGVSPSNGVRKVFDYTATAGQTSFSGSDNNSQTLAYTDSAYVDVFQNGVLLVPSDYTATTGTSVVLDTGATVSDSVQIVVFDVFSVADTVSKADGGTFAGNIGMGGTLSVTGVPTFTGRSVHSGGITIANDGQIGSVGDADAMSISSSGVVTFTQPPVGAGGLVKLYTQSSSSGVSSIDITDTYINTTYDTYYIIGHCLPASDGVSLQLKLKDSSGIITGNNHSFDLNTLALGEASDGQDHCRLNYSTIGNAAGEGSQFSFYLEHVNSDTIPCVIQAQFKTSYTGGQPEGGYAVSGMISSQYAKIIKGFNLAMTSGNIASNNLTIYGIVK